jgi:hypothetical protein
MLAEIKGIVQCLRSKEAFTDKKTGEVFGDPKVTVGILVVSKTAAEVVNVDYEPSKAPKIGDTVATLVNLRAAKGAAIYAAAI